MSAGPAANGPGAVLIVFFGYEFTLLDDNLLVCYHFNIY